MRTRRAPRVLVGGLVGLAFAALTGLAGANHSLYQHISQGEINGNGSFGAFLEDASADGARVFFGTDEQLVSIDTDSSRDIYEHSGGSTKLVSAGQINGNGPFDVSAARASADGTRVFLTTPEQLVSGDTDSSTDVYERSSGLTKRVSAGQINGNGAFTVGLAGSSADGTRVFFITAEPLVSGDSDSFQDLYERSGGSTKRVSAGQINGNGAFTVGMAGSSADGTRVFFLTSEQLVSADTDSSIDLYERSGGSTKRVSAGQINGNGAFNVSFVGSSADGTRVFFTTAEPLVSLDTDSSRDVYERSGGSTKLVSAGQINGNGAFDATFGGGSADGTHVFFVTAERLIGNDNDSETDVYERSGGTTKRVSVGQINGNGPFGAQARGISTDGARVFFTTNEHLVPGDTDAATDIYERSGGSTKRVSAGQINGNLALNSAVYERAAGTTRRISLGSGPYTATFAGASLDGSAVFFSTPEQIFPDETDGVPDIFGAYLAH